MRTAPGIRSCEQRVWTLRTEIAQFSAAFFTGMNSFSLMFVPPIIRHAMFVLFALRCLYCSRCAVCGFIIHNFPPFGKRPVVTFFATVLRASIFASMLSALFTNSRVIVGCRVLNQFPVFCKSGSVARTVPGMFRRVVFEGTSQVRASWGGRCQQSDG